jgi:hypothetical protein
MPNAKLGAKVDRYSFFVRLLPPLLHTGLARRTNISITLIDPGVQSAHGLPETDFGRTLRFRNYLPLLSHLDSYERHISR